MLNIDDLGTCWRKDSVDDDSSPKCQDHRTASILPLFEIATDDIRKYSLEACMRHEHELTLKLAKKKWKKIECRCFSPFDCAIIDELGMFSLLGYCHRYYRLYSCHLHLPPLSLHIR